jgi:hypothetical protein
MKTLSWTVIARVAQAAAAAEPAAESPMPDLEAPFSKLAAERVEIFKRNVKSFRLQLEYNGVEDKPFYRPRFAVSPGDGKIDNPFSPVVQISEEQALKLIDQLARDGAFDNAYDLRVKARREPPTSPGYTLDIWCDELPLREDIGWGKALVARLDNLSVHLDGDARKAMDFTLGRISFLRREMP